MASVRKDICDHALAGFQCPLASNSPPEIPEVLIRNLNSPPRIGGPRTHPAVRGEPLPMVTHRRLGAGKRLQLLVIFYLPVSVVELELSCIALGRQHGTW